jgi:ABC-type Fe3+ transport system substrate-binding protein
VVAEANREGKVVVYGPAGDLIQRYMTEGFRRAFPGITLEWSSGRATEMVSKLEGERRGGIYNVDLFIGGTSTAITQLKPMGLLDPIKPALMLPEATDPRHWMENRLDFADTAEELVLVFVQQPTLLATYAPRQVRPDEIAALSDLLSPKWKGRLVLNDPTITGAGHSVARLIWAALDAESATTVLRALREQAGAVDRDLRRQVEWIAHGRYPILIGPSEAPVGQLEREGVDLGRVTEFTDIGGNITSSSGNVMLVNRAPHPNAANVFINWLLTREGQTAFSTAFAYPSRRVDVPTDHLDP